MWTQADFDRIEEKRRAVEVAEMRRSSRALLVSVLVLMLAMFALMSIFPDKSYSLYSTPDDDPNARTLVATFTSAQGAEANRANCETMLAALQQRKPAYKVRFTCDKGKS